MRWGEHRDAAGALNNDRLANTHATEFDDRHPRGKPGSGQCGGLNCCQTTRGDDELLRIDNNLVR
jgi:hypothetical protein